MSTLDSERHFLLICKLTHIFRGNPFQWNSATSKFQANPGKFYQVTRYILNAYTLWSLFHWGYWYVHAVRFNDQPPLDTMLDFLYMGGACLVSGPLLGFIFLKDSIVEFVNAIFTLNKRLREDLALEDLSPPPKTRIQRLKRTLKGNWKWYLALYLQYNSVSHALNTATYYMRQPFHRRYQFNVLFGTVQKEDVALMHFCALLHFINLMEHWGLTLFFTQLNSLYYETTQFWVKETTWGTEPSKFCSEVIKSERNTVKVMRAMQLLNQRYNHVFGGLNFLRSCAIWANIVGYTSAAILFADPELMPEYTVLPLLAIFFTLYSIIIIKYEMYPVLSTFEDYVDSWKSNKRATTRKFLKSLREFKVELGGFFHVTRESTMLFVFGVLNDTISVLLYASSE